MMLAIRPWIICAADLGLLCCLVMHPNGVFRNYPQLRITWLVGMVDAIIEAYTGGPGRNKTVDQILNDLESEAARIRQSGRGRCNISCGTGAAERMLKEIYDSIFKLSKDRIYSEEGMKVWRVRKLQELQSQYAKASANHDFLTADIQNIQENGVIKRIQAEEAKIPLGAAKRKNQVKVFAQRLYHRRRFDCRFTRKYRAV